MFLNNVELFESRIIQIDTIVVQIKDNEMIINKRVLKLPFRSFHVIRTFSRKIVITMLRSNDLTMTFLIKKWVPHLFVRWKIIFLLFVLDWDKQLFLYPLGLWEFYSLPKMGFQAFLLIRRESGVSSIIQLIEFPDTY